MTDIRETLGESFHDTEDVEKPEIEKTEIGVDKLEEKEENENKSVKKSKIAKKANSYMSFEWKNPAFCWIGPISQCYEIIKHTRKNKKEVKHLIQKLVVNAPDERHMEFALFLLREMIRDTK